MQSISIYKYNDIESEKWDYFVLKKSINGTFLQTRKFIDYHPRNKFADHSLIFKKGSEWCACVLACESMEEDDKSFISHPGTTFGGLVISPIVYNTDCMSEILDKFEEYIIQNNFKKIYLKLTPDLYSNKNTDLIDYLLYQRGYKIFFELNFYLNIEKNLQDNLKMLKAGARRNYRYAEKQNFVFRQLKTEEVAEYRDILEMNLEKHGRKCIHSLEELLDLKVNRFPNEIEFWGVFFSGEIIAGSMIFLFNENVVHTQYLAARREYLNFFPMEFLICKLLEEFSYREKKILTFGICTEDQGRYLNLGLSRFKEKFGADYFLNKSYEKNVF